jgi:AhpC/TSA family
MNMTTFFFVNGTPSHIIARGLHSRSSFQEHDAPRRDMMKRVLAAALLFAMTSALPSLPAQNQKPQIAKVALKVGDAAPDFTLLSDQWKPVKLSDYRGKKNVLLAIYVLAFTGG